MSAAGKPQQAAPDEPHWVVVSLSAAGEPAEITKRPTGRTNWHRLFRHMTEAAALAECARLANATPGTAFRVYASGGTSLVRPAVSNVEQAA